MVNLYEELKADYEEVTPLEFYRDIFKKGELDEKDKFTKGKFTGIACEFCNEYKQDGSQLVKRYSVTDSLEEIEELLKSENFVIISPIGYVGKSRKSENARVMYAFAIEIDGILRNKDGRAVGYYDLKFQMKNKILPTPNYFVASGNGLHLYYIFDKPLLLFPNVSKSLKAFKEYITQYFWNRYVTTLYKPEQIQYESVFQGFRLVGGVTKGNNRVKAFKVREEPCSVSELNSFVLGNKRDKYLIEESYKSNISLTEAREKYPDWYKKRIEEKKPKGTWIVKRNLYDWWYKEIATKRSVGHRYYCMMLLCIYAIKCDISREELEKDCYSLLENFDSISDSEENRFTVKDIVDALQAFEDKNLITYPINSITTLSAIPIVKNKRNFRKQKQHIEIMNAIRDVIYPNGEWRKNNGRPKGSKDKQKRKNKEYIVKKWREENPEGRKSECHRVTGLDPKTIRKYWGE